MSEDGVLAEYLQKTHGGAILINQVTLTKFNPRRKTFKRRKDLTETI